MHKWLRTFKKRKILCPSSIAYEVSCRARSKEVFRKICCAPKIGSPVHFSKKCFGDKLSTKLEYAGRYKDWVRAL